MKIFKKPFFLILLLSISTQILAQRMIKGTVKDNTGEALIGANVVLKGTTKGAVTDADGIYSIQIPKNIQNPALVFSYIGYKEKVVVIDTLEVVNAILDEDPNWQNDVVVGPGAHQIVDNNLPGRYVLRSSEKASTNWNRTRIVENTVPLYIIDGVEIDNTKNPNVLSTLNPDDIESVNVLKEPSAISPYGKRGENGVVIITTKQKSKKKN